MKALVLILSLSLSLHALAGGSIAREDALAEVCAENARLCAALGTLGLAESGTAIRLRTGQRVMPFEFRGQVSGEIIEITIDRDELGTIEVKIR